MSELIYLATPFSHENRLTMYERYVQTVYIQGNLLREGRHIYSPIAHTYYAAELVGLPKDWQFWQANCELMLSKCDKLLVAKMDGWEQSKGVQAEIEIAKKLGLQIEYLDV